jgi:hypothetical protein
MNRILLSYISAASIALGLSVSNLSAITYNPEKTSPIVQIAPGSTTKEPVVVIPKDGLVNINPLMLPQKGESEEKMQSTDSYQDEAADMKMVIHQQLADIVGQDLSKAYYAYTSKEFQKNFSLDVFKAYVRKFTPIFCNKTIEFEHGSFQDVIANVKCKLTARDNQMATVQYDLIKEDGLWKIRGLDLTPHAINHKPVVKKISR